MLKRVTYFTLFLCCAFVPMAHSTSLTPPTTPEPETISYTFKVRQETSPQQLQQYAKQLPQYGQPPHFLTISRTLTCNKDDKECMQRLHILQEAARIIQEIEEATQETEDDYDDNE